MRTSSVLLDTNVASFFVKRSIESPRYEHLVGGRSKCLSIISVGELRFGAVKDNWGNARCSVLESFVDDATIMYVSDEIAAMVAIVMNRRRREGRRMEWNDAWIAATAMFHRLPLVTHDRDFLEIEGLEVITELRGFEVREPAVVRSAKAETTAEAAMEWLRQYLATLEASTEEALA
jgi:predicted nucleic acid-binding protein